MRAQSGVRSYSSDHYDRPGRSGESRGQNHNYRSSRVTEKRDFRYYISKYLVYFVVLVVVGYVAVTIISQQPHINKMQAEMHEIQVSIDNAKKENARLKEEKKEMNTKEYKERVAREKLGLVKKNEKVFVDISE